MAVTQQSGGQIADRLAEVQQRMQAAARRAGREVEAVKLVAVSKEHALPAIQAALAAGVRDFGENYLEEALPKVLALQEQAQVQWHMIGHIQSRKAQAVVEHFAWLQSLDRLKLAQRLDRFSAECGRRTPVLIECNVSGEQSKFGLPAQTEADWIRMAAEIEPVTRLANLEIRGLMTMAPYFEDMEMARPYFRRLVALQGWLKERLPDVSWSELSMGMSGDFEVAIEEGATIVRIGTAIFGERDYA